MDSSLHIKIEKKTADYLKKLADSRNTSRGQLVREALSSFYQPDVAELPKKQAQALSAYQGGYISIGKLSEVMGLHVLEMRTWLNEHEISQNNSFMEADLFD